MSDLAERMCEAFWAAADATRNDETLHGVDVPLFDESMDMVDMSRCVMPRVFWDHMADWWQRNGKW